MGEGHGRWAWATRAKNDNTGFLLMPVKNNCNKPDKNCHLEEGKTCKQLSSQKLKTTTLAALKS
jgi:hypothetical protein